MCRLVLLLLLFVPFANAQTGTRNGIVGRWQTPQGDVIEVAPCGANICMNIAVVHPGAPASVDHNNPDPAQRTRPLCNLRIGSGFRLIDSTHAEDGQLYDPKTGKTYSGLMSSEGDRLKLRGYIGIKMFGRTETWTRVAANASASTCQ